MLTYSIFSYKYYVPLNWFTDLPKDWMQVWEWNNFRPSSQQSDPESERGTIVRSKTGPIWAMLSENATEIRGHLYQPHLIAVHVLTRERVG